MCKDWFKKKPIIMPEFTKNTIVATVVGDYPGTANDLAGPPYDLKDFQARILKSWPYYTFRNYLNEKGTAVNFLGDLEKGVSLIGPDDLLLFINDNCYAASNTKGHNSPDILGYRYHPNPVLPPRSIVRSRALFKAHRYLAMSASLSTEPAADARFDHPNGAYTYALLQTLEVGITYLEWHQRATTLLRKLGFKQTPVIEGPIELASRKVFEGNVTCFYNSCHGSYTYDKDGDEGDGQDEGPYFYDRLVIDDEINAIIAKNQYLW